MFHATAKALNSAAASRADGGIVLTAQVEDVVLDEFDFLPAPIDMDGFAMQIEELAGFHIEFRWSDSKLMQASERLAEAQEQGRKDLVALAIMRRELRATFAAERKYIELQRSIYADLLAQLASREGALAELVDAGAHTEQVIADLAAMRAERKLHELAIVQIDAQLARIADSESTLEFEVLNEQYDLDPSGDSMRELARLRSLRTSMRRAAVRVRNEAAQRVRDLGFASAPGEITAIASFRAAELEGDERGAERMARLRGWQVARELKELPEPSSAWRAGLRHPVSVLRARRTSGA
jgi:hypothetical protein